METFAKENYSLIGMLCIFNIPLAQSTYLYNFQLHRIICELQKDFHRQVQSNCGMVCLSVSSKCHLNSYFTFGDLCCVLSPPRRAKNYTHPTITSNMNKKCSSLYLFETNIPGEFKHLTFFPFYFWQNGPERNPADGSQPSIQRAMG